MRASGALVIGLSTALVTAAWLAEQVKVSFAQTRLSASSSESVAESPRKGSAPRKQTGISENRYTVGLVTGALHTTEFDIAQEIANTLASGQETGPHGEVALRLMPMVGNGGARNILDILTLPDADMAITPVIVADRLREARTFGDVQDKLVYIAPLYTEEFSPPCPAGNQKFDRSCGEDGQSRRARQRRSRTWS